jgi:DNA-binding transcriptional MerR regulator
MLNQNVLTIGEIAKRLNYPIHRIEYVIRSRNIQPIQRAGNLRIFSPEDVEFIAHELHQMNERRR